MTKKQPQKPWSPLGEPIRGFDSTNGVVDVTEDREPDRVPSEIDEAMWRTGQMNIGMG